MAVSADGLLLYACGNLSNRLFEIDTTTGTVSRTWSVGVAPYDVVLVDGKAFVSNWGGREPVDGDLTGPAGRGTVVRVDPIRHIASEGSVTVIDLEQIDAPDSAAPREILTGLHACALAVSPDKKFVICANAGADTLSVLDVESLAVVETIWTKAKPSDLLGASPNALAVHPSGEYISGYRTTAYCVSPYARRGALVQTQYNTTSILRTIDQILGLPPMNQFDASATPMFDCFADMVNLTPFDALPTNIPLDQMNPELASIVDPQLREDALVSLQMNFREVDRAPEDTLNRILWRAVKGTTTPYPEWAAGIDDDDDDDDDDRTEANPS